MRFAYLMIRAICRCHGLLGDAAKGDVGAGRFASVWWVSCLRASRPLFRRGTEALPRLNSRDHRALGFSMLLFGRGVRKKAGALGAGRVETGGPGFYGSRVNCSVIRDLDVRGR